MLYSFKEVEPLWPVDIDVSTGPGHAGAIQGNIHMQPAPQQQQQQQIQQVQQQQSFSNIIASMNVLLQQKLVSHMHFTLYTQVMYCWPCHIYMYLLF